MALTTLQEALNYLDIEAIEFEITGNNNNLYFKYDGGVDATPIILTNATYDGDAMATHLKAVLDVGFSTTFTVLWSATTYKFTITHATNTIQYIHTNSTAGYTIGFTEDSSAVTSITSDTVCSDPTSIISTMKGYVEKYIKNYCHRDFESTAYTEIYNGTGLESVALREYPITSIMRVSIGERDIFSVYNTNTESYANVSCDGTNFILNKDGSETTLALASYTTMETLITAINGETGWVALINSTEFNNFKSTEILEFYGKSCLDSQRAYIQIRNDQLSEFSVDLRLGVLWLSSGVTDGFQNVYIDYTGGYATIPDDLKFCVLTLLKSVYSKWREDRFELDYMKIGEVGKSIVDEYPIEVKETLQKYKRVLI
ncbi:MAG: hypothetical protein H8E57_05145 [Candidatus Cloacimonetes bacterium]|nr:hypothetical protein [Candidatus Cloacimonadota bacterium]